jgi:hypothetical protein
MTLVVADRVKQGTSTAGTGTVTLSGSLTGYQTFSVIGDGNTTYYTIVDSNDGSWEVGLGTYTASGTTLSRDTVLDSSNAGALVNFAAGTKEVFVTYPAEKAVYENEVDDVAITGNIYYNARTISVNRTIAGTENAMSIGPIEIDDGVTVTVDSGGEWVIV